MAVTLNLTDGTNTIDFTGSVYRFLQSGLELPPPTARRLTGGDPTLAEGERLIERSYANRKIAISFNIAATDHDDLVAKIRDITRMLDVAKKTSQEVFGPKVALHYRLDDATDEVVFDVRDGTLDIGDIASPTVRRGSKLLKAELELICEPYARLANPTEISNFLLNPSLSWNPGEGGRDAEYYLQFGSAGERLERSVTGMYGDDVYLILGMWVYWDSTQGAITCLVRMGSSTIAYELVLTASNKLEFTWWDTGATAHTTLSNSAFPTAGWHFIGVTNFTTDGTDTVTVLMLDEAVIGDSRLATTADLRTPVGDFTVGASASDAERFGGKIAGLVITKTTKFDFDMAVLHPYQLRNLYYYGLLGTFEESIMSPNSLGLQKADFTVVCPFSNSLGDTSGLVKDYSGNGRDLTVLGSPTKANNQRMPGAWTLGSALSGSDDSGLSDVQTKNGLFSLHLDETGDANLYIEQEVDVPDDVSDMTVILWVYGGAASKQVEVTWESGTDTITATNGAWTQHIRTKSVTPGGTTTLRIKWTGGAATDIYIAGIMLSHGKPFGTFGSMTDVTSTKKPFVGSRFLRAWPDSTRVFWLDLADFPGDAPVTTRVFFSGGDSLAPIRMGAVFGRNPWKQTLHWRASLWLPDYANSSDYTATDDPTVSAAAGVTAVDRLFASVHKLYPFPVDQLGSFKIYVGVQSELNMTTFARMVREAGTIALTGDAVRDPFAAAPTIHVIDSGILSWPPEVALKAFRDGTVSAANRTSVLPSLTPKLSIANLAEVAIAAPNVNYEHILFLPIEHGHFTLQSATNEMVTGLPLGEILVVDTIEEDAAGVGYIARNVDLPAGISRLTSLAAAEVSMFGTGFKIQPESSGLIAVQFSKITGDEPLGVYAPGTTAEMWLEYNPRFLYV